MAADPERVKAIFLAALERPAGAGRATYLDSACGGPGELRRRVEALLLAHDQPGSFLASPAAHVAGTETFAEGTGSPPVSMHEVTRIAEEFPGRTEADPAPPREVEEVGSWIGPFRLIRVLGQGGMGVVYMAEQERPIRRRVAIKVIHPGTESSRVVARFEAERQALAMMDHPNIANVLEAGQTEAGRPYFVMELVPGLPITQYCDAARLTTAERLALFIPVCEAIQHAHQKGIIHRDVKPSNVLVTTQDGGPVAKVIDFGIAKSFDQRITERSLLTEVGAILGTLEYMSPEQAEMGAMGVDTRADVYALGVLLHELLVGSTPLERVRLRGAGLSEILRTIREEEPQRPSDRLAELGDSLASVAALRKTEPSKLARQVRGDLDWVVLKALQKDRRRRYESANALARDIRRHLDGDPVEAYPPGVGYRLGKFLRRHRGAVAAASLLLVALVAGVAGTGYGLVRALEARRAAEASAEEARAVVSFFQEQMLAAARPQGQEGGLGKDVTLRQAIDAMAPKIHESFKDRPLVEAALSRYIGDTYTYLSEFARATSYFERAYALRRAVLGPDHPDTFVSVQDLGDNYLDLLREDLALPMFEELKARRGRAFGPDDPRALQTDLLLGRLYIQLGDTRAFLPTLTETLAKLRAHDPRADVTKRCLAMLGLCRVRAGDPIGAIPLLEEAVALAKGRFGADHMMTCHDMMYLSTAYYDAWEIRKGIEIMEETLEWQRKHLGPNHIDTIRSQLHLGSFYVKDGRLDQALKMLETARAVATSEFGADDYNTLGCNAALGTALLDAGRPEQALSYLEPSYVKLLPLRPPDHLDNLRLLHHLGSAHAGVGEVAKATREHRYVAERSEARFGPGHPLTILALNGLGCDLLDAGSPDQALPVFERASRLAQGRFGDDHPDTLRCRHSLAMAHLRAGSPERARPLLRDCLDRRTAVLGEDHPDTLATGDDLGECLLALGHPEEAEAILQATLRRREAKDPGAWSTSRTRSTLASAVASRGRYDEAESLALAAYEGMKGREGEVAARDRARLAKAAERIASLYDSWSKPEKAALWRSTI